VPEFELPGRQVGVQKDGRDFYASFREYDVRAVLVTQTGRPVGELPRRYDVHRRHGHAHGHDARIIGAQKLRIIHPNA